MDEKKLFAVVELEDRAFRFILSAWIKEDDTDGLKCIIPCILEKKILKAIHEHKRPDSSWLEYDIVKIHCYSGNSCIPILEIT